MSYVTLLETFVAHPGLNLSIQWSDNSFQNWGFKSNAQISGGISNENGPLKVFVDGYHSAGDIIAAQRTQDLPSGFASHDYLMVSIMTSSINVAARIVIWTDPNALKVILLKTYNDTNWHTEVISLKFFDLSGDIYMIELSMMLLQNASSSEWATYKQLSIANLEL